jgi:hypothetical protein
LSRKSRWGHVQRVAVGAGEAIATQHRAWHRQGQFDLPELARVPPLLASSRWFGSNLICNRALPATCGARRPPDRSDQSFREAVCQGKAAQWSFSLLACFNSPFITFLAGGAVAWPKKPSAGSTLRFFEAFRFSRRLSGKRSGFAWSGIAGTHSPMRSQYRFDSRDSCDL